MRHGDVGARVRRQTLLLRDDEKATLMNDAAVSTITFYTGTVDVAWLRSRMRDIMRCNPILSGLLVSGQNGPQVDYDESGEEEEEAGCFEMVEGPAAAAMVPSTAYDQLAG